jgi:hypothetical protein
MTMAIPHSPKVTTTLKVVVLLSALGIGLAVPAGAEPDPSGGSNAYSGLRCDPCQRNGEGGSSHQAIDEAIQRELGR